MAREQQEVRLCVCGDSGVGKSTLLLRYAEGKFDPHIEATIGAAYRCRQISARCRLHLWDTAGQEQYMALCPMYLRNADIVLVALPAADLGTARERAVAKWMDMSRAASSTCVHVLVATKADLLPVASLYRARGMLAQLADELGVRHHHVVSSKSSEGCPRLGEDLDSLALDIAPYRAEHSLRLPDPDIEDAPGAGCCW